MACIWMYFLLGRYSTKPDFVFLKYSNLPVGRAALTRQSQFIDTCAFNTVFVAFVTKLHAKLHGTYPVRGKVLMQMRQDGYIGFPGGSVLRNESLLQGLHRELAEEMGILPSASNLLPTTEDYLESHRHHSSNLCVHLFTKQIDLSQLLHLLANVAEGSQFISEVNGYVFPPLYIMAQTVTGLDGLPVFLSNQFVGNTLQQLEDVVLRHNLISHAEWMKALYLTKQTKQEPYEPVLAHFFE